MICAILAIAVVAHAAVWGLIWAIEQKDDEPAHSTNAPATRGVDGDVEFDEVHHKQALDVALIKLKKETDSISEK